MKSTYAVRVLQIFLLSGIIGFSGFGFAKSVQKSDDNKSLLSYAISIVGETDVTEQKFLSSLKSSDWYDLNKAGKTKLAPKDFTPTMVDAMCAAIADLKSTDFMVSRDIYGAQLLEYGNTYYDSLEVDSAKSSLFQCLAVRKGQPLEILPYFVTDWVMSHSVILTAEQKLMLLNLNFSLITDLRTFISFFLSEFGQHMLTVLINSLPVLMEGLPEGSMGPHKEFLGIGTKAMSIGAMSEELQRAVAKNYLPYMSEDVQSYTITRALEQNNTEFLAYFLSDEKNRRSIIDHRMRYVSSMTTLDMDKVSQESYTLLLLTCVLDTDLLPGLPPKILEDQKAYCRTSQGGKGELQQNPLVTGIEQERFERCIDGDEDYQLCQAAHFILSDKTRMLLKQH